MLACHSFCMQIKTPWGSWAGELSPLISFQKVTLTEESGLTGTSQSKDRAGLRAGAQG